MGAQLILSTEMFHTACESGSWFPPRYACTAAGQNICHALAWCNTRLSFHSGDRDVVVQNLVLSVVQSMVLFKLVICGPNNTHTSPLCTCETITISREISSSFIAEIFSSCFVIIIAPFGKHFYSSNREVFPDIVWYHLVLIILLFSISLC